MIEKLRPTKEDRDRIQAAIDKVVGPISTRHEVFVGGSIAKDTWLRKAQDIDLFVRFPKEDHISEQLENTLGDCGFDYTRVHGSRDYFQVIVDGYLVEIIPIVKIDSADQAHNITDVSPLHVAWVQQHREMADEIRLSKAFAKAQKVYGAESYIQGLSGYCLEILTIFYKGFEPLLKAASGWNEQTIIDIEGHHKDPVHEINESKISPLILIDPVDPGRNAAASLSKEKYDLFRSIATGYLKSPGESWFIKKPLSQRLTTKENVTLITIEPLKGKKDVIGCKIRKVYQYIAKQLEFHDFRLIDSDWEFNDKAYLAYAVKQETKDSFIKTGPPLDAEKDAERFKEKHPDAFIKDGRLYAKVKSRYKNPQELFRAMETDPYVKEKVKSLVVDFDFHEHRP
ncbi:MAG: CCA tRNA nucleotidyltransferase [Candidatus Woesearchaeota archaeon]